MVAVSLKKIFFKQKTAYEIYGGLVGSEMCIRDRREVELGSQENPEEIKRREVELGSQENPEEITRREVELGSQENPEEIKRRQVELDSQESP